MNNYTRSIASIMRYNVSVRDTLEYVLKKESFDARFYAFKKKLLSAELEQNTPLKVCLVNSADAGKKLLAKLREMIQAIYGDDSTIVRLGPDNFLRVDFAQRLTVLKLVLPVHDEITKIVVAHVNGAKKAGQYDDPELDELLKADELFYRGFAYMSLLDELDLLFSEYNKARNEAKGAVTPQSNFIQHDISDVVNLLGQTRRNALVTSMDYYEVVDPLFALVEMTSGRRDLPDGKHFGEVFTDVKATVRNHVTRWEADWKARFEPFMKRFIEDTKEYQKKQEESGASMQDKGADA